MAKLSRVQIGKNLRGKDIPEPLKKGLSKHCGQNMTTAKVKKVLPRELADKSREMRREFFRKKLGLRSEVIKKIEDNILEQSGVKTKTQLALEAKKAEKQKIRNVAASRASNLLGRVAGGNIGLAARGNREDIKAALAERKDDYTRLGIESENENYRVSIGAKQMSTKDARGAAVKQSHKTSASNTSANSVAGGFGVVKTPGSLNGGGPGEVRFK